MIPYPQVPNSYIGLTNLVWMGDRFEALVKACPLDRLLVETDAPFFLPKMVGLAFLYFKAIVRYLGVHQQALVQYRSRSLPSHPGHSLLVARFIADAKNISMEEVGKPID